MRRFDFLRFRRIAEGREPIPPELDADPEVGPLLREARSSGLPLLALLQLFAALLPTILALLNQEKP